MPKNEDWKDVYLKMIGTCLIFESRLNDWERDFVSSIDSKLSCDRVLTQKQIETLEKISEKVSR